ncbi:MAG TPA: Holliday junction branch migration protein RuvA [Candidatus Cloacimonadota bacterium]|nr:Holliday junction branch migration protein RuvA [Candidatus Cloacimonadota bacterium]HOQ80987.1 Holliday junction branch migration protein RuvA [Candidatus Cloacimonadota bacterium]
MFAYLSGILAEKSPGLVVIDCNGIGYELRIPMSTFDVLPDINEKAKLFTHVHFNTEDGNRLFGFFTTQEKDLFKILITLNRVGPRTALSILSTLSVVDFVTSIHTSNHKLLATTPGLGTKTAQKMIIELKDKINQIDVGTVSAEQIEQLGEDNYKEAEAALTTLGFKAYEISKAFRELRFAKKATTQEIIKQSIQYLYQKRNEL